MKELGVTPGEWAHDLNGTIAVVEDDGEWGQTICQIPQYDPAKDAANAHLMAASKSLYEALSLVDRFHRGEPPYRFNDIADEYQRENAQADAWREVYVKVQAALAKAQGNDNP